MACTYALLYIQPCFIIIVRKFKFCFLEIVHYYPSDKGQIPQPHSIHQALLLLQ